MSKFEKKFGKYAIPNLTLILIMCYVVGYIMQVINADFLYYLTLDPERILFGGHVWRILTWIIVPPDNLNLFTLIMLFFYYNIGTLMERTLGTYRYNVYIIGGILLTVVMSFLCYGLLYALEKLGGTYDTYAMQVTMLWGSQYFSTYYINISIFLAFAVCYPDMQVLLMFVVPVKVKWMGILDLILLTYSLFTGVIFERFAVAAALINFLLFYLSTKNISRLRPKEVKRRAQFKQQVRATSRITRHKCAICGQTETDNENLEFRFCSKCNGNYEYCQEHLFTHEHVK